MTPELNSTIVHLLDRNPAAATALAREALVADPEDIALRSLLAVALAESGQHDEAIVIAQQAIQAEPGSPMHWVALAKIYRAADRSQEAIDAARRAVELDPTDSFVWYAYGRTLLGRLDTGVGDSGERSQLLACARHAATQALELDPAWAESHILAADVHNSGREWRAALESSQRGLSLEPMNAMGHRAAGQALLGLGRRREAGNHLLQAGHLNPRLKDPAHLLISTRGRGATICFLLALTGMAVLALAVGAPPVAVLIPTVLIALSTLPRLWLRRGQFSRDARSARRSLIATTKH